MSTGVLAVIPARLNSRRFPGKLLYQYKGRPLLYYVWRQVCRARLVDRVVIATDSAEIGDAATAFGAEVFRSRKKHRCGSDRVAEAAERFGGAIVLNVQGDSLGLPGGILDRVLKQMKARPSIRCATLATAIDSDDELFSPNVVKVIRGTDETALWFSRYPIPYLQHPAAGERHRQGRFLKHIGVYFFRAAALRRFASWLPTPAEQAESLEQLRILEHGERMALYVAKISMVSVDSPRDIGTLDNLKL